MSGAELGRATIPEGSVVITPAAMYAELQQVAREVRHISTLLDPALTDLRNDTANLWSALNREREAREAAIDAERSARQSATRWGIGTVVASATAAVAVLSPFIGG